MQRFRFCIGMATLLAGLTIAQLAVGNSYGACLFALGAGIWAGIGALEYGKEGTK